MFERSMMQQVLLVVVTLLILVGAITLALQFTDSNFTIGVLGAVAAIVTASLQYRAAKDRETDARLFSQKQEVYSKLIETVMGLFNQKGAPRTEQQQTKLVTTLQEIRTQLLIWGSFDTVFILDQASTLGGDANKAPLETAAEGTRWLSKLFASIRRDLGHKDTKQSSTELALGMLNEPDRSKVRELMKKRRL